MNRRLQKRERRKHRCHERNPLDVKTSCGLSLGALKVLKAMYEHPELGEGLASDGDDLVITDRNKAEQLLREEGLLG